MELPPLDTGDTAALPAPSTENTCGCAAPVLPSLSLALLPALLLARRPLTLRR